MSIIYFKFSSKHQNLNMQDNCSPLACEHFCSRTHNGINVMMLRMNEKLSSDSVSTCFHAQRQVVVYKE